LPLTYFSAAIVSGKQPGHDNGTIPQNKQDIDITTIMDDRGSDPGASGRRSTKKGALRSSVWDDSRTRGRIPGRQPAGLRYRNPASAIADSLRV